MEIPTIKLNVDVRFSAFDSEEQKVCVKKFSPKGKPQFRVRIFLEGPDVDKVRKVVYHLHPTFPDPIRKIYDRPNFELEIWTWGTFELPVDIYDNQGGVDRRVIDFDYSADIQKAQSDKSLHWIE
jgi:transcription initiation factor IIF auxiliary subunit